MNRYETSGLIVCGPEFATKSLRVTDCLGRSARLADGKVQGRDALPAPESGSGQYELLMGAQHQKAE